MEKHKLTESEVKNLQKQYFDISGDLRKYRRLFFQRRFWKAQKQLRKDTRNDYKFLRFSLNATIETLCATDNLTVRIASHAIMNGFVTIRTKWLVFKNIQSWTMQ